MEESTPRPSNGGTQIKAVGRPGVVVVARSLTEWDGLDPYDFRLAVWLSTHTEEYERGHSQAGIARRLNMSQERVQKSLAVLERLGLVSVTANGQRGSKVIVFFREAWETAAPLATREVTSRHTGGDLSPHETLENTVRNTVSTSSSETSSPPPGRQPPARKRDEIWDALVETVGPVSTRAEQSRRAGVVKQLRAVQATPEEIRRRSAAYHRRWKRADLTDTALMSHWSKFAPSANKDFQESYGEDFDEVYR